MEAARGSASDGSGSAPCGSVPSGSSRPIWKSDKIHCPHCSTYLSLKTFKTHQRLYYDCDSEQWIKKSCIEGTAEWDASDDEFSVFDFDYTSDPIVNVQEQVSGNEPPSIMEFDVWNPQSITASDLLTEDDPAPSSNAVSDITPGTGEEIEVWEDGGDDLEIFNEDDGTSRSSNKVLSPLISWLVYLIALIQRKHYLPNAAVSLLLKVLSVFFIVLGRLHPQLSEFSETFPSTIYSMQTLLNLQKEVFTRYVTCPKCNEIYSIGDCVEISGTKKSSKYCSKQISMRSSCNALLLKTVENSTGQKLLFPLKTYCYMPIKKSLQDLLNRPEFHSSCEKWRTREKTDGMLADIYDGKIWNEFQEYNEKPFLSKPFAYALMLNVDWFQPFKHTEYSLGAVYLSIMNLPREIRFKQENTLLLGLIPGPREPSHDVNSFLTPLVDELLDFLQGVSMSIYSKGVQMVRCMLLCVACDIPACRKISGFVSHSATLGCSRCLKQFPGSVGKKDYSGFDRSTWPPRSVEQHRRDVDIICRCQQKTRREHLESTLGCRFSVLLKLPYFDPVRMSIIDPMHNLYLGTAKQLLKIWLQQEIISKNSYQVLQEKVDSVHVPPKIGRIPLKIASSFSGFTADQFKNWTNLFSLLVLHEFLPTSDLECWRHFVLASRLLTKRQISTTDIQLADAFLLHFCKRVERMYGSSVITPNMHMHCHIRECLQDYGPVYNFWLFSFERYNGIFESFPSNNRTIEIQFMQRFLRDCQLSSFPLPQDFKSDFSDLHFVVSGREYQGSLQNTIHPLCHPSLNAIKDWTFNATDFQLPKSYIRSIFSQQILSELKSLFSFLYPEYSPDDIAIYSTF